MKKSELRRIVKEELDTLNEWSSKGSDIPKNLDSALESVDDARQKITDVFLQIPNGEQSKMKVKKMVDALQGCYAAIKILKAKIG
jgi:seryl-tRNA synthetase